MREIWNIAILLPLFFQVGCGGESKLERVIVCGEATYQGKPIEDGVIRFVPLEGTKGPVSGAMIEGGRYEANIRGGVPVGKHRVEIQAFRKAPSRPGNIRSPQFDAAETKVQYLPAKYNGRSELKVTVGGKGEQTENFQLQ